MRWFPALLLLTLSAPVLAQSVPGGDVRYQTLSYAPGATQHISTSPQSVQTVLFAPGELIRSVILSDPAAYMVIVAGRGDSLSLRANSLTAHALMTVQTDLRTYSIDLAAGEVRDAPEVIRFSFEAPVALAARRPIDSIAEPRGVTYRLSGSKALLPASIRDDGAKTYMTWRDDQAMPAIFALSPSGAEEMVDGYVRGGLFTIDHVYNQLIFRIDREEAKARRIARKDRHARK